MQRTGQIVELRSRSLYARKTFSIRIGKVDVELKKDSYDSSTQYDQGERLSNAIVTA